METSAFGVVHKSSQSAAIKTSRLMSRLGQQGLEGQYRREAVAAFALQPAGARRLSGVSNGGRNEVRAARAFLGGRGWGYALGAEAPRSGRGKAIRSLDSAARSTQAGALRGAKKELGAARSARKQAGALP